MNEEQKEESVRLPGEVVEYYEQPETREIVEIYVQDRLLPGRRSAASVRKKKKHRLGLWIFLICLAIAVGLAALVYFWPEKEVAPPAGSQETYSDDLTAPVKIPVFKPEKGVRMALADGHDQVLTAQKIYSKVNPAVVTVIVQLKSSVSIGTGVLFTSNGYLMTNYHVVAGGLDCSVALDTGKTYEAKYVAGDSANDIAVLKVEATGLPTAEFGDSDDLVVGDEVYAIGNPLGVELRGTFTNGIVSAINRDVQVDERTMTLIQTNAALNSGNSGGPLINQYGQVVGINTIKMSSAYSSIEGLGFALPTASVQYLVNDLLAYGHILPEPVLGISVSQIGTTLPDGTVGVEVFSVQADSAAAEAGVKKGDYVIRADNTPITASRDLLRVRRRFNVGDKMTMTVYRDGKYLDLTLNLTKSADQ